MDLQSKTRIFNTPPPPPPHPLANFEIQKYYQNEPRFNIVYSAWWNKGWGISNSIFLTSIQISELIGLLCMLLVTIQVTYLRVTIMLLILKVLSWTYSKEIKKFIDKSTVVINIFRMQSYDSVMCDTVVLYLLILCL